MSDLKALRAYFGDLPDWDRMTQSEKLGHVLKMEEIVHRDGTLDVREKDFFAGLDDRSCNAVRAVSHSVTEGREYGMDRIEYSGSGNAVGRLADYLLEHCTGYARMSAERQLHYAAEMEALAFADGSIDYRESVSLLALQAMSRQGTDEYLERVLKRSVADGLAEKLICAFGAEHGFAEPELAYVGRAKHDDIWYPVFEIVAESKSKAAEIEAALRENLAVRQFGPLSSSPGPAYMLNHMALRVRYPEFDHWHR